MNQPKSTYRDSFIHVCVCLSSREKSRFSGSHTLKSYRRLHMRSLNSIVLSCSLNPIAVVDSFAKAYSD